MDKNLILATSFGLKLNSNLKRKNKTVSNSEKTDLQEIVASKHIFKNRNDEEENRYIHI